MLSGEPCACSQGYYDTKERHARRHALLACLLVFGADGRRQLSPGMRPIHGNPAAVCPLLEPPFLFVNTTLH